VMGVEVVATEEVSWITPVGFQREKRAILERCLSGDHAAFEILVRENEGRVFGLLYSLTGNAEEARDLTQDTFIRVYRRLHLYDPQRPFMGWLFAVARNIYRDSMRRRKKTLSLEKLDEDGTLTLQDREVDAETAAIESESYSRVWEALQRLDPEQREILVLKDISDLSYADIAGILNVPEGTVASRVYYARRAIRNLLIEA